MPQKERRKTCTNLARSPPLQLIYLPFPLCFIFASILLLPFNSLSPPTPPAPFLSFCQPLLQFTNLYLSATRMGGRGRRRELLYLLRNSVEPYFPFFILPRSFHPTLPIPSTPSGVRSDAVLKVVLRFSSSRKIAVASPSTP